MEITYDDLLFFWRRCTRIQKIELLGRVDADITSFERGQVLTRSQQRILLEYVNKSPSDYRVVIPVQPEQMELGL